MKIDFCLPNQNGKNVCLKDFRGKWVVVYFYPKDDTPGCTIEAIDFTRNIKDFEKLNAKVLGISADSGKSHCSFIEKHDLKIELLSDAEKKVIKQFGVWGKKKLYGKEYEGIIRSTFLINPEGKLAHEWKNMKVENHVEQVLNKIKELRKED